MATRLYAFSLIFAVGCGATSSAEKKSGQAGGPLCTVTADPATVAPGGTSTLTIHVVGVSDATILNGSPAKDGDTLAVTPLATSVYAASVTGSSGSSTCQATVTVSASTKSADSPWQPVARLGAPPSTLDDMSVVRLGGYALVYAGIAGESGSRSHQDAGYLYDPAKDLWKSIKTEGGPGLRSGAAIQPVDQDQLFVWGGAKEPNPTAHPILLNDGAIYSVSTDAWTAVEASGAPTARIAPATAWTGTEIFVWGGNSSSSLSAEPYADGGLYDPAKRAWRPVAPPPNAPKWILAQAVWTGKNLVVVRGRCFYSQPNCSLGLRYDPATAVWTAISEANGPGPGIDLKAAVMGGKVVVTARFQDPTGNNEPRIVRAFVYDFDADAWSQLAAFGDVNHYSDGPENYLDATEVLAPSSAANTYGVFDVPSQTWRKIALTKADDSPEMAMNSIGAVRLPQGWFVLSPGTEETGQLAHTSAILRAP